ncbi:MULTISPECIES: DNA translocase FtsK [unclassified Rhizobium]|uniref:DNA translocase FtsK n=1 Tax=unclassified Rhizobium TaxID=2613769 RepID=UPI0007E9AEE0|nr:MULTISPECIES: DNA translocase FtsK [unclassified Rhizobium]ANK83814.1 cell division DNA translocase FtsK/SpoIIIE family protein [Rhizobium sp. N731]ANL14062.1 cell division DNA translocase FtsK/SpoIIIE family protein [Rhizobium sp. N1314]
MRFPRTNLTDAADFSSGIETELPEENPGERPPAPIWQSNFSLAPNVRFTRTPETLISRRRPSNEPVRCESEAEQQAIRIEPVAVDVPFDIYLPEPAEPAVAQAEIEALQPPAAAAEAPTLRVASELSSISDFAFWEVMAFEEGEPVRAPSIILPKIETAPESITSRFRIMEWRPGALKPAQTASRPVQPPAAAPAPVAPRPPAAISLERPVRTREAAIAPAPQVAPQTAPMPQVTPVPQPAIVPQPAAVPRPTPPVAAVLPSPRLAARPERVDASGYEFPPRALLQEPPERLGEIMSQETLEQNAGLLESVLEDFGIKGEIIHVRPGPVVTLYEFEPAPGVKSSRVIGLADDIARSMSALSARVAVVPGRNVIGIELPNVTRETVYFREMIESQDFDKSGYKLALGLGKTIGGEPVIAELAKMPHLLVAGTTGSGKSVAINTMILSLLYRMTPEQCRLIMVDPKMLELSVYDGIPHLLTPVVTDPKKAVMALKWAVREMEERYRKMSRLGVRNIDGYNGRVSQAREKGETIHIMVQVGFDRQTGAPIEESQELDLAPMPYIVVIVDEMADLMMVAGKEIEGAIQRLAQMARAAGIHLIMATQRPSVDVITGTIKANFPTRISFQVTSKIDSRTILGEQGAEQLLGQGDMLHMQGGGRIARVHGPFVSDAEVEKVVAHLKTQGRPEYLDTVTADEEEEPEEEDAGAVFDKSAMASEDGNELYEQAVKVVMRDKKCSTSYIQRRLGIGYNRAASLVERMEKEGLVGPANHVGKREIVSGRSDGD